MKLSTISSQIFKRQFLAKDELENGLRAAVLRHRVLEEDRILVFTNGPTKPYPIDESVLPIFLLKGIWHDDAFVFEENFYRRKGGEYIPLSQLLSLAHVLAHTCDLLTTCSREVLLAAPYGLDVPTHIKSGLQALPGAIHAIEGLSFIELDLSNLVLTTGKRKVGFKDGNNMTGFRLPNI